MRAPLLWWRPWISGQPPAAIERFAYPLPDKPSIAVLPFINVSSDPKQDHLAEGLTDDLITELSKVSGLFVIARHSVFALEDTAGNIQEVAAELGVHFVLEGTLQRAESRLRINVNLIDALTGLSLWAERYDREYADIFAVQDEVIGKIISALAVKLSEGRARRSWRGSPPTTSKLTTIICARSRRASFTATSRRIAGHCPIYQKAIDLDPDFANAHAGIARVAVDVWRNDYNLIWSAAVARKIAYDAAGQALKLDPDNARAHTVLALLQLVDGRQAEAIDSANRAVTAQPNDPEAFGNLALVLAHTGSREQAIAEMEKALRLDPAPPASFQLLAGVVFYTARENERAIPLLEAARDGLPNDRTRARISGRSLCPPGRPAARGAGSGKAAGAVSRQQSDLLQLSLRLLARGGSALPSDGSRAGRHPGMAVRLRRDGKPTRSARRTRANWSATRHGPAGTRTAPISSSISTRPETPPIAAPTPTSPASWRSTTDRLCEKFEGYFLDRMACGYVYRNTTKDAT